MLSIPISGDIERVPPLRDVLVYLTLQSHAYNIILFYYFPYRVSCHHLIKTRVSTVGQFLLKICYVAKQPGRRQYEKQLTILLAPWKAS